MKWLEALKQWNTEKGGRYTIPKKGTPEYEAVRSLQGTQNPTDPTDPTVSMAIEKALGMEVKTKTPRSA